ncbi:hypothetical protein BMS3Abin15_00360 [bacterium BMS3Abin15]|nr:hypothetical protein BMS3Abin15_00360 [bacterium BMS3Abin15]HDH07561.1 hypothetical protein [Candidatus Moranbacteria bacterium]HDZ85991.1 hypothetical protein [Candidatus Moranbacteria bacterium]
MESKKIYLILATVAVIGGFIVWGLNQPEEEVSKPVNEIVYYYGEECPHCQDVAKFLEENNIAEKVSFSKKEVWSNQGNKNEMNDRARECGLDISNIGVPFLYTRGECLIGTPNVTEFFKKEAGL